MPTGPTIAPFSVTGRYCRLEPLCAAHADDLFEASKAPEHAERFAHMTIDAPRTIEEVKTWIERVSASPEVRYQAVIDLRTGSCEGRLALLAARAEHRVIELGAIYFGGRITRTRIATEALYLSCAHGFERLGMRRLEWKCDARNVASIAAAQRLGFIYEGTSRQHMLVRGRNRDTAWFSMLDHEWPDRKDALDKWLIPENFGLDEQQLLPLQRQNSISSDNQLSA